MAGTSSKAFPKLAYVAPFLTAIVIAAMFFFFTRAPRAVKPNEAKTKAAFLHVYRAQSGNGNPLATPALESIHARDELAFAIENHDAKKFLIIVGVNDRGRVYWFYPARIDAGVARAIPIGRGPMLQQLPDAPMFPIEGTTLTLHAIFLDVQATPREVESMLGSDAGQLKIDGAIDRVLVLRVEP